MQQMQLRAALKMNDALTKADCALTVSHVNQHRKQQAPLKQRSRQQTDLEAFANHLLSIQRSSGDRDIFLLGEALGQGGIVRLPEFNVQGTVLTGGLTLTRGQKIRVRVRDIAIDTSSIIFDIA
jgi:hypothetical protein